MNYIKNQENLNEKIVLLRLDLNVPLKNGIITDETRINKTLPILKYLLEKKSKIIVISHIGRPKGKWNEDLSLKPICENFKKKLNKKIKLIRENLFKLKKNNLFTNLDDEIIFLENLKISSMIVSQLSSLIDFPIV